MTDGAAKSPVALVADHSFFFTALERDEFSSLTVSNAPSIIARLCRPLWFLISKLIPDSVAPNSIALLGAVFALQAYQVIAHYYKTQHALLASWLGGVLLLLSSLCSALDGVHAKRCRSGTTLGHLFSETSHIIKHIFFALSLLPLLGVDEMKTQWYVVMALQLMRFIHTCVSTSRSARRGQRLIRASALFSSSEMSLITVVVALFPAIVPAIGITSDHLSEDNMAIAYWAMVVVSFTVIPFFVRIEGASVLPLFLSVLLRAMPSFLVPLNQMSQLTIIADATVVATMSFEVTVSQLTRRTVHRAIPLLAVLSGFNSIMGLVGCVLYICGVFLDLSIATNTPLFVPIRNVYIDGVYDLCHVGHKRVMEYALKFGNRLIVGVMADEACVGYKRKPIMTTEERCREVRSCKFVSQIIPGAPCDGLTEEFLKEHNIHVVVYGEEYDRPNDKYYAVVRKLGIGQTAPRTQGMSTSELIRRISEASGDDLAAKDKLRGDSTVKC